MGQAEGTFLVSVVGSDDDFARVRASTAVSSMPFMLENAGAEQIGATSTRAPDVAVIGSTEQTPLPIARQIRSSFPDIQIVFLLPHDRLERFRATLPFVPNLASAWTADIASDPESLASLLREAASASRQRAAHSTVLGRINQQLASRNAKPAEVRTSQLAMTERYLATILTQSPDAFVAVNGCGSVVAFNDAAVSLFGRQLKPGDTLAACLPNEEEAKKLPDVIRRAGMGETVVGIEVRLGADGGPERHAEFSVAPVHGADGGIASISISARDVTERKQAEHRQSLLVRELNHRVKNTLAVVQALARQSFKGDAPTAEQRAAFSSRLAALAAAHDLLTERSWQAAPMMDIVWSALHACGADRERAQVTGAAIVLPPDAAVSLAIALHELCTNAIKYGAFSTADGQVRIRWSVDWIPDGARLRLEWIECGGPAVTPPQRRGFGLMMLERGLADTLNGSAKVDFAKTGVIWRIDAPVPRAED